MSDHAGVSVVPHELLEALAAETPVEEPPPRSAPVKTGNDPGGRYTSRLLVERWLTDRGAAFRVKAQPDGKGRTVYVLKECPFDSGHGDPDACIMQDASGKMSAQCFHDSCRGRGWQEFKKALGPPNAEHYDPPLAPTPKKARKSPAKNKAESAKAQAPDAAQASAGAASAPDAAREEQGSHLPEIQGNKRQLRDVTEDACVALRAANDPPRVFQRGDILTRLRFRDGTGFPYLEPLGDAALRGLLARVADWKTQHDTEKSSWLEDAAPPLEVVKDLASLPAWDGIPPIVAVVECPVFTRAGLVATSGFHAAAGIWYQPALGLDVPPVPDKPDAADLALAKKVLLIELLGDFPFKDEASRAHALAALLLPFVRPLIDGPTPLHLLDAPVEGTGKTLVANVIGIVSTGRPPEAMAEGICEEEWRKRLTALLCEGPTFILLDNINRVLDSGALAAALTSDVWKDRILGVSKTASLPNRAVWLASGNNTRLSRELIRRTVWARLDSRVDAPWERQGFRHANLMGWAKTHRGDLVWAALTLCQAWIAQGRPAGKQTLGMFESWAEVIGGILDVAGVPGLLANAKEFRAGHTDKVSEWRAFATAWWQEPGEQPVGVEQLFALATRDKLLDGVLGDKGERSQRTRLGVAMGKAADRVFGEYRIEHGSEDHRGRQQYRLRNTKQDKGPGQDVQQWEA
jgi:putative DNA primase/helicase